MLLRFVENQKPELRRDDLSHPQVGRMSYCNIYSCIEIDVSIMSEKHPILLTSYYYSNSVVGSRVI